MVLRRLAFRMVEVFLAIILLLAAGLKGYQLATEPVTAADLFTSRWFLVALVEFELVFGMWLLTGLHARRTWVLALAVFVVLAEMSLYKAVSGESSCGCFGKLQVSPWYTLLVDLAAVGALIYFRPPREAQPIASYGSRVSIFAIVACVVGIPSGIAIATYAPSRLSDTGEFIGDSNFVVLEPETWVGKRFPLLNYIDVAEQLQHGEWVVVLFHHDCPKCQELIPKYISLASRYRGTPRAPQIALIELPPYEVGQLTSNPTGAICLRGKVLAIREWFVQAPAVIQIKDGEVVPLQASFKLVDEPVHDTRARRFR